MKAGVTLTQVIHPLELLGDRHSASRFDCDYHPDCVAKEVPCGLVISMRTTKCLDDEDDEAVLFLLMIVRNPTT